MQKLFSIHLLMLAGFTLFMAQPILAMSGEESDGWGECNGSHIQLEGKPDIKEVMEVMADVALKGGASAGVGTPSVTVNYANDDDDFPVNDDSDSGSDDDDFTGSSGGYFTAKKNGGDSSSMLSALQDSFKGALWANRMAISSEPVKIPNPMSKGKKGKKRGNLFTVFTSDSAEDATGAPPIPEGSGESSVDVKADSSLVILITDEHDDNADPTPVMLLTDEHGGFDVTEQDKERDEREKKETEEKVQREEEQKQKLEEEKKCLEEEKLKKEEEERKREQEELAEKKKELEERKRQLEVRKKEQEERHQKEKEAEKEKEELRRKEDEERAAEEKVQREEEQKRLEEVKRQEEARLEQEKKQAEIANNQEANLRPAEQKRAEIKNALDELQMIVARYLSPTAQEAIVAHRYKVGTGAIALLYAGVVAPLLRTQTRTMRSGRTKMGAQLIFLDKKAWGTAVKNGFNYIFSKLLPSGKSRKPKHSPGQNAEQKQEAPKKKKRKK